MISILRSLTILTLCLTAESVLWAQTSAAPSAERPVLAPRELIVMKPGVDRVWGTWITAVIHKGAAPEEFSFYVNIPRESVDFQPGEGLVAKDLKIESDGIKIQKAFAPGVNVVSILFAVPAQYGLGTLTLSPRREIPEMTMMTPKGLLTLKGAGLVAQEDDRQDGQRYEVLATSAPLSMGKEYVLNISGVPEGRSRIWILGGVLGGILLLSSIWFTWRTRPQVVPGSNEDREGAFA